MPKNGLSEEIEKEVGQAEGKLFTHRSAFSRASVIQAFLGSAPQLTLQLYISVLQQNVTVGRTTHAQVCLPMVQLGLVPRSLLGTGATGCDNNPWLSLVERQESTKQREHLCVQCSSVKSFFMTLSLLSIVYGALRCNILAIKIKYDEYEVKVKPLAYVCIFLWRSFEIATRVIVLVLFTSVMKTWVVLVVLINFFSFFLYPWILFWFSGSPFPENIEKALTRVGTTIALCFLTLLYAGINMFCWSAVQLKIDNPDLISKSQNWYRLLVYYMIRFIENAILLLLWYIFKTDIYMYVCAPLLILQLLVGYCAAILFMLVFYQFFHPCKKLFSSSVSESFRAWLRCVCWPCRRQEPCESTGKTDLKLSTDRDETPSSSKISPEPTQILSGDDLCSA
nr:membrane transport protein XK isoform X3 [Castor canadensis]